MSRSPQRKSMQPIRRYARIVVALLIGTHVSLAWAHCDALDGPVVLDARSALENGDVTPILKWVSAEHEAEVRDAFSRTLAVRAKGQDARALADMYLFETIVRIHRAGEGEAYTGLKPAGSVEPGIRAADAALMSGSGAELANELASGIGKGIHERFDLARERSVHAADNVDAGREYVEAYVDYIHYVETVHRLTIEGVSHQHHEPAPATE